jgi:hypothetical protein
MAVGLSTEIALHINQLKPAAAIGIDLAHLPKVKVEQHYDEVLAALGK